MITSINSGNTHINEVSKTLDPTILFVMVVFDTIKSRDEFASKFPKSLNVTSSVMSGRKYTNGQDMGVPIFYPYCSVRISEISKSTGHSNEAGYKRMNRFYDAIISQYQSEGSADLSGMMDKHALLKLPE